MVKTIFFYLDGVGYKFLEEMPFLKNLGEEGTLCRVSVEPLHQMEFSIFASQEQKDLNLWTWYYHNPKSSPYSWTKIIPCFFDNNFFRKIINYSTVLKEYLKGNSHFLPISKIPLRFLRNFDLTSKKSFIDKNPIEIPTFFDILRGRGISYYAYEWPIYSTELKTGLRIVKKDDSCFLEEILKHKEKDFLFAHLTVFDGLLHKFGSENKIIRNYLRKLDRNIEKVCNGLLKEYPDLKIFVVSDHGMVNVREGVDITNSVKNLDIVYFADSTCLRAWGGKKEIEKLRKDLEKFPGKIYTNKNKEKCPISFKRNYSGDLLFIVEPGFEIFPNFFNNSKLIKAMHGYDKTSELDALFVHNYKITNKKKIPTFGICPLVFKSLKIPAPLE